MYTPKDSPYVSHAEGLALHTAYVEKFWSASVSMYDVLVPDYERQYALTLAYYEGTRVLHKYGGKRRQSPNSVGRMPQSRRRFSI